jgi:hypothetical protein
MPWQPYHVKEIRTASPHVKPMLQNVLLRMATHCVRLCSNMGRTRQRSFGNIYPGHHGSLLPWRNLPPWLANLSRV